MILNGTSKHHPVTAASAGLLAASAAASVGFGVIRGRTIELFERDGELWERATWATIAGWIGLLVTRIVIVATAAVVGATLAASPSSIPLMLAITLAAQMIVVGRRAGETGRRSRLVRDAGGRAEPVDELISEAAARRVRETARVA